MSLSAQDPQSARSTLDGQKGPALAMTRPCPLNPPALPRTACWSMDTAGHLQCRSGRIGRASGLNNRYRLPLRISRAEPGAAFGSDSSVAPHGVGSRATRPLSGVVTRSNRHGHCVGMAVENGLDVHAAMAGEVVEEATANLRNSDPATQAGRR